MTRSGSLAIAALVACALFAAEDVAVLGTRSRIGAGVGGTGRVLLDAGLAVVMVAYNYAASRYVATAAGAWAIDSAIDAVAADDERRIADIANPTYRSLRRLGHRLAPFRLLSAAAGWVGRAGERLGARAGRRGCRRTARLVGDLGMVNVLGVPGAGLAVRASGASVGRRQSLRHASLFVCSWFAGARLIAWIVDRVGGAPAIGPPVAAGARAVGDAFAALTDVGSLLGAFTVGLLAHVVVRDAIRVERTAAAQSIAVSMS